jgi:hypothetical protein
MDDSEAYILPSDNDDMRKFIKKFKIDMMETVVHKIKFAIDHNLELIEVFQFKDSKFVVTISNTEFIQNLNNIIDFYKKNEIYELCNKAEGLLKIVKNKNNEKEKPNK